MELRVQLEAALDYYGIPYTAETYRALNVDCPWCGQGKGSKNLGIFFDTNRYNFSCWKCGRRGVIRNLLRAYGVGSEVEYSRFFASVGERMVQEGCSTADAIRSMNCRKEEVPTVVRTTVAWPPEGCMPVQKVGGELSVRTFIEQRRYSFDWLCDHEAHVGVVGRLTNRLVWPVRSGGVVVAYQGRWIGSTPDQRKYLTEGMVSDYFYGFDAVDEDLPLIIVEGVLDAWRLSQGIRNVVASFTSSLSVEQRLLLSVRRFPYVVLCWDGDKFWHARKTAQELLWLPYPVYVPNLGEGDPDSLGFERVLSLIDHVCETKHIARVTGGGGTGGARHCA